MYYNTDFYMAKSVTMLVHEKNHIVVLLTRLAYNINTMHKLKIKVLCNVRKDPMPNLMVSITTDIWHYPKCQFLPFDFRNRAFKAFTVCLLLWSLLTLDSKQLAIIVIFNYKN